MEAIGLSISVGQLGIYFWLPKSFASHLQVADKFIMLPSMICNLNYLNEIRRILGLDVGVCQKN